MENNARRKPKKTLSHIISKLKSKLIQTETMSVESNGTREQVVELHERLTSTETCKDKLWKSRFNKLCLKFGFSLNEMDFILEHTSAIISGSSALWCFKPWCKLSEYTGDLDLYIRYSLTGSRTTEKFLDLAMRANGYTSTDTTDKIMKCPVCNKSEERLKMLNPCGCKICTSCIVKLEDSNRHRSLEGYKCPSCDQKVINLKDQLVTDNHEQHGMVHEYSKFVIIRYYKEYTKKSKKIQVIFVDNPTECVQNFDLSCCCVYIRRTSWQPSSLKLEYMYHNITLLHSESRDSSRTVENTCVYMYFGDIHEKNQIRIKKYTERGYKIQYVDPVHCINYLINNTETLRKTGLNTDLFKYVIKDYIVPYGQELVEKCARVQTATGSGV